MDGRTATWRRRLAALLCAAAVLAMAGCVRLGRDQDTQPTTAEETLHLFDAYAQGITDPVLGHTVQVTGVGYGLPDLDSSGKYPMVLIRVKATAGPKQRSPYPLSCADLNVRHGAAVKVTTTTRRTPP
ncbi:MAG: hypothetical protein ACTIJJ_04000 [Galactobacter sp.]